MVEDEIVSVDDPELPEVRATLAGLREAVSPDGETAADRDTVPENPPRLAKPMTDVPEVPN